MGNFSALFHVQQSKIASLCVCLFHLLDVKTAPIILDGDHEDLFCLPRGDPDVLGIRMLSDIPYGFLYDRENGRLGSRRQARRKRIELEEDLNVLVLALAVDIRG